MKKANLKIVGKIVDQQHEEAVRREQEEEKLTPEEIRARVHEIRGYLEKVRDAIEGVPFAVVDDEPSRSLGDIGDRSVSDLVEHINPFIKGWYAHCAESLADEAGDEFGFLIAGQAETGFAIGVLFCAILNGASDAEIDRLERGFIHSNALRWWYREGIGK